MSNDIKQIQFEAFRIQAGLNSADELVIQCQSRYALSIFALICGSPFFALLCWIIFRIPQELQTINENNLVVVAIVIILPSCVAIFFVRLFGLWCIHCLSPRVFVFGERELCFQGIPGKTFSTSISSIESIELVTYLYKSHWTCHISIVVTTQKKPRRILINYDQIYRPAEVRFRRKSISEDRLIEINRPLAELIASRSNRSYVIRRNASHLETMDEMWW
tara:strand:+ start:350 stop:1009 length:660 start_codon:yes stop_codon:yes gene_type:complete